MSTKKILLIGCAGVAAIGLVLFVVFVLFVTHVAKDPEGMKITVNAPATVARGKEFELVISVVNERKDQPLKVGDIDISEEYLKGFSVISAEPQYVSSTKTASSTTARSRSTIPCHRAARTPFRSSCSVAKPADTPVTLMFPRGCAC